ncbi:hypothetical protein [Pseudomonas sp. dw_358]|uniref:hypothetical protein n=1 Tax=Pseudomonas sp. dw_358 TaxID=2720083 RepID=UPI001BD3E912|nr:hypothetical protein [Pseudomonas sp. dw_358]
MTVRLIMIVALLCGLGVAVSAQALTQEEADRAVKVMSERDAQQAHGQSGQLEDCLPYSSPSNRFSKEFLDCVSRNQTAVNAKEAEKQQAETEQALEAMRRNSPSHSGWSYQRCVIKNVPDAQNDLSARTIDQDCQQYPYYAKELGTDFFGYKTADECTLDSGKKTASRIAYILIKRACDGLYP